MLDTVDLSKSTQNGWGEDELRNSFDNIIMRAEERFGDCIPGWKASIKFGVDGPLIEFFKKDLRAEILLPSNEGDFDLISYHLAHECVHFITPAYKGPTNYFEEGVATYFASDYYSSELDNDFIVPKDDYYGWARILMADLLNYEVNAVKKIRERQPEMFRIVEEDILIVCPAATKNDLAGRLVKQFPIQNR